MATVNVHAAKTHFSQLLERVAQGEEVVIAKAGKPLAGWCPSSPWPSRADPVLRAAWAASATISTLP